LVRRRRAFYPLAGRVVPIWAANYTGIPLKNRGIALATAQDMKKTDILSTIPQSGIRSYKYKPLT